MAKLDYELGRVTSYTKLREVKFNIGRVGEDMNVEAVKVEGILLKRTQDVYDIMTLMKVKLAKENMVVLKTKMRDVTIKVIYNNPGRTLNSELTAETEWEDVEPNHRPKGTITAHDSHSPIKEEVK